MAKFLFENLQNKTVTLVIEPWAMAEEVLPDGKVVFEVSDDQPPEIQFAIMSTGDPCVCVYSSVVKFHAAGRDWEFREKSPD
jgi:hypothetical protein